MGGGTAAHDTQEPPSGGKRVGRFQSARGDAETPDRPGRPWQSGAELEGAVPAASCGEAGGAGAGTGDRNE